MRNILRRLAIVIGGALVGCAPLTRVTSSWQAPDVASIAFQRPAAVFVTFDAAERRTAEAALAREFPRAMASCVVVPFAPDSDDLLLERMRSAGFDGAIIVRVVGVEIWTPEHSFEFPVYSVETRIYEVEHARLLFAAQSETAAPESTAALVTTTVRDVVKRLRKSGSMAAVR